LGEEPGEGVETGTSPEQPSEGDLAKQYSQKLGVLTPLAKKAISEKLVDPTVVGALLQAAQKAAAGGDFATGLKELQTLDEKLKEALAAPSQAEEKDEDEDEDEEPSTEQDKELFEARLKTVGADLLIHLRDNPDDRDDLTELLHEARDAGRDGQFAVGHLLLDRIDRIIVAGKRAAREREMGQQIPEGAGSSGELDPDRIEAAVNAWLQARETAVQGAAALAEALRGSEYEDVRPIAAVVDELVASFPEGLDDTLEELRAATLDQETPRIKQFQSRSKTDIKACLDYLNENSDVIAACEQHPLGGPRVAITAPLKQSLKQILEFVK
jgi:hypothetical protein